eukprot:GAHX01001471.1.p1 GENE.GAHX01001471.1~~GAHX01001471.1.p1  ORF type:complete len:243 (-),score=-2.10 GAHX01001471.1:256-984(-)
MKLSRYWLRFRITAETLFVSCCYTFATLFMSVKLVWLIFHFNSFRNLFERSRFVLFFLPFVLSLTVFIHMIMSIASILSTTVIYYTDHRLIRSYNVANRITSGLNLTCILVLFYLVFFSTSKHLSRNNYQFVVGDGVMDKLSGCKLSSFSSNNSDPINMNWMDLLLNYGNKIYGQTCPCCKRLIEELRKTILRLLLLYTILQVLLMDAIFQIELLAQVVKKNSTELDIDMYDRYALDATKED